MARKVYRVNPDGGSLIEGGEHKPGSAIELDEERAASLGDALELDAKGKPVVIGSPDAPKKSVEDAPNKMQGRKRGGGVTK